MSAHDDRGLAFLGDAPAIPALVTLKNRPPVPMEGGRGDGWPVPHPLMRRHRDPKQSMTRGVECSRT